MKGCLQWPAASANRRRSPLNGKNGMEDSVEFSATPLEGLIFVRRVFEGVMARSGWWSWSSVMGLVGHGRWVAMDVMLPDLRGGGE